MRTCKDFQEQMPDAHMGRLNADANARLQQHLATCADCRESWAATQLLLDRVNGLTDPEPSPRVKINFKVMLDEIKATEKTPAAKSFWTLVKQSWASQPRLPLAYGVIFLLICAGVVYWNHNKHQEASLQQQSSVLLLLENPLASERIKAINYTGEMKQVDKQVIDALQSTLNNDLNDNVRLSALEALSRLADKPEVRSGLIQSIARQESPVLQIAIAEVMLKLHERRSVEPLKELLKQQELDPQVKDKVRETITKLI
jgi:hypothetical protein